MSAVFSFVSQWTQINKTKWNELSVVSVFTHLSKQTAPRLKSSWVVFQPWVSEHAASPWASRSYLSAKASVTAASASIGVIRSSSWPRSPRMRWKVSFREPALDMTALKSCGRMELRLGRDSVLPWGHKRGIIRLKGKFQGWCNNVLNKAHMKVRCKQILASHTSLAGGSMAARSPRILSLEHSENTCSWRGICVSLSSISLATSEAGEFSAPGPDSEAEELKPNKKKNTNAAAQKQYRKSQLDGDLLRTTGERGSSLDTDGVWLRLAESKVSWVTSFFFSPSGEAGGTHNSGGEFTSLDFFSFPVGLPCGWEVNS